jgi:CheY-like chemotaxis protein
MSISVLICDDSNLARKQVLRNLPEQFSSVAELATNGEEALTILREKKIDLLFLDYKALKMKVFHVLFLLYLPIFSQKCKPKSLI